jgi:hypothetical protein
MGGAERYVTGSGYQRQQCDWNLTKVLFAGIKKIADENEARLLIIVVRDQYSDFRLNELFDKLVVNLADFGKDQGIMVVNYLPALIKHAGSGELLLI